MADGESLVSTVATDLSPSPISHLPTPIRRRLMRLTAELDEGAEEQADGGEQQPGLAVQHKNDSPTEEEGEREEHRNGQGKFHAS